MFLLGTGPAGKPAADVSLYIRIPDIVLSEGLPLLWGFVGVMAVTVFVRLAE